MKQATPWQNRAAAAVLALFFACFLFLFVRVMLFNSLFHYNVLLQLALLAGWTALMGAAGVLALRHKAWVLRHRFRLLAAVLAGVFAVQLWVGFATAQQPAHDYGTVYNGALAYATQGDGPAFAPAKDYLHHFTNNIGSFLVLQLLFRGVAALGLTCFYQAAMLLGHLLFSVAILFTFLYLDKAFGPGAACASLLLWAGFLPMYFQGSVLYTDTLSVWIAPVALYLCRRATDAGRLGARLGLYAGFGALMGLGLQLKATAAIVGIALVAEALCANWKRGLLLAGVGAAAALAVWGLFSAWAGAAFYDPTRRDEAMPATFWVMMGLTGDGGYNAHDEWVVNAEVSGKAERAALHRQIIAQRLADMGPAGTLRFLSAKTLRTFGCGNAEIHYMLTFAPDHPGHWIYKLISADGPWFKYFNNLSQGAYLAWTLFGLAGVPALLRNKVMRRRCIAHFAPYLALVGFFLFMLMWEANYRQLVNQWPLYIIVASVGCAAVGAQIVARR